MTQQEAKQFVNELYANAVHKDAFFENVTVNEVIKHSKLNRSDYEFIDSALHFIRKYADEKQAICESSESDKVLEFRYLLTFPVWFQEKFVNGDVCSVYYNNYDELVCQDGNGEVYALD